jgi:hypothetical protein
VEKTWGGGGRNQFASLAAPQHWSTTTTASLFRNTTGVFPSSIGLLCFSAGKPNYFTVFGLAVLLRGRLGRANGCPSLRLGWVLVSPFVDDWWGRSSQLNAINATGLENRAGSAEPFCYQRPRRAVGPHARRTGHLAACGPVFQWTQMYEVGSMSMWICYVLVEFV